MTLPMAGWVKQLQLVLRAAFAGRFRRQTILADAPAADETMAEHGALPRTESEINEAAARSGFTIAEPCMPGVVANLAVLSDHAETMLGHRVGTKI
jgi:sodium/bile acid cotransporter 7